MGNCTNGGIELLRGKVKEECEEEKQHHAQYERN